MSTETEKKPSPQVSARVIKAHAAQIADEMDAFTDCHNHRPLVCNLNCIITIA